MQTPISALSRLLGIWKTSAKAKVEQVSGIYLQEQSIRPGVGKLQKTLLAEEIMEEITNTSCRRAGAGMTGFVP